MDSSEELSATLEALRATASERPSVRFLLRLYVIGTAPASARAIVNTRRMCEEHLRGRYELEIIDIKAHPAAAGEGQVLAAPTLVKCLPLPVRRFIGDMSQTASILARLEVVIVP